MNLAVAPSSHWQISTRPTGEVLTARTSAEDVDLVVLGIPSGFTVAEVEGWMRDLMGVARETSRNDSGERPIPGLLHHILTGLLFSHAELWDRAGGALACSCVFLRTGREVAFGWVGERDPDVWIRGQRLEVEWVRVRDDEGREARAFAIDAEHPLELKLVWPSELEIEAEGRSIELSARWPARAEAAAAGAAPATDDASAPGSVFTMAKLSNIPLPSAAAPGSPLDLEPRESIEPEVASEVQSQSWPPPEPPPTLPEALPQDAPGLTFAPPAPEIPAAARWEELGRMMNAPPPPESAPPVAAARPVEPAPPVPAPISEAVPMAHAAPEVEDDAAWDLESMPPVQQAPPAQVVESPVAPPSGEWSVVYESDGSVASPGDLGAERRKKGLLGWVSGLFGRKAARELPMPLYETSDAPYTEGPQAYAAPAMPMQAEPVIPPAPAVVDLPPAPAVVELPPAQPRVARVARVEVVAAAPPPPAPRVTEPPAIERVAPLAPVAFTPEPFVIEPVGMPAAPPVPRAPTTVARAVAVSNVAGAREEAAVPWLDEMPLETPARVRSPRPPRALTSTIADGYGETPLWKKPWAWGVVLFALFAGGWLVGALQDDGTHRNGPGPMQRLLRGVGLGGARFEVTINSRPPGAWISVGGKDLARRTPATIDLAPGEHPVTLSFSDLGAATYNVRGERGDRVALDAALWGSLAVRGSDMSIPIAVSVDGKSQGFAPVLLDSLAPGPHEVRFSGPGMPSWSQTVTVRVGEASDVLARPMTSPATGVIAVRASAAGMAGSDGINGAAVYIDGVRRGSTPFTAELPRGPHSIRVEHQSEVAPVQVIDLPGGNQRFATFEFGLDIERPTMAALAPPARIPMDRPAVISASLLGVGATEVREMWLHVRTPDETWRRYQMVMMKATGGVVGVAVFPPTMFDSEGRARWYVSASTQTGDDYFTELQSAELQAPAGTSRR